MNDSLKFKIELDVIYPIRRTIAKSFKSLKILRQWAKRNDIYSSIYIFEVREYILTNEGYQRFVVFGNTIVSLSELVKITTNLIKSEELKSS